MNSYNQMSEILRLCGLRKCGEKGEKKEKERRGKVCFNTLAPRGNPVEQTGGPRGQRRRGKKKRKKKKRKNGYIDNT